MSTIGIENGQIWRKRCPYGWLKVLQILDPEYPGYDGGLHGARVSYLPPQLKGIQCRGGTNRFITDVKIDGDLISWEEQVRNNRYVLGAFKRGEHI